MIVGLDISCTSKPTFSSRDCISSLLYLRWINVLLEHYVFSCQGLFYKLMACVRYNEKRARRSSKRK